VPQLSFRIQFRLSDPESSAVTLPRIRFLESLEIPLAGGAAGGFARIAYYWQ
jgi:hypothetical protein